MYRVASKSTTFDAFIKGMITRLCLRLLTSCLLAALIFPAGLLFDSMNPPVAQAQSYRLGYTKYERGDIQGAEQALMIALRKRASRTERAQTWLVLGICQYMLGKSQMAAASFQRGLQVNPRLDIGSVPVLDKSVIPLFESQRRSLAQTRPTNPRSPPAARSSTNAAGQQRVIKQTLLVVKSNVANAQVYIDGIILGTVNTSLNVEPGVLLVEVQANGYLKRRAKVRITKDRQNTITMNLEKPKPKAIAKPTRPKPKRLKRNDIAQTAQKNPTKSSRKRSTGIYAPVPDDDLFLSEAPADSGSSQAPSRAGDGRDLASEFALESSQPYGGTYPPQAGGYAPPPAYAYPAPPPVYYAPPPPTYYVPPAPAPIPPPPPADPYASDPYATNEPPVEALPPDPVASVSGPEESVRSKSQSNTFIALLPFGAGQFQNGQYLLGAAFLGAELGALYYYYTNTTLADKTAQDTNSYVTALKQQYGQSLEGMNEQDRAAANKFIADRNAYVESAQQSATIGLAAFGAFWAIGAVHAIVTEPEPKPKKRKRRKYSGFSYDASGGRGQANYKLVDIGTNSRQNNEFHYQLGLAPTRNESDGGLQPLAALELKWTF